MQNSISNENIADENKVPPTLAPGRYFEFSTI